MKKITRKQIVLLIICIFICSFVAYSFSDVISYEGFGYIQYLFSGEDNTFSALVQYVIDSFSMGLTGARIDRFIILLVINLLIAIHGIFGPKKVFLWLFSKRWIIGLIVLVFLVANKYNGDSLYCYDVAVQTGYGSEYSKPIIGVHRGIRSDEWMVSSMKTLNFYMGDNDVWDIGLTEIIGAPQIIITRCLFVTLGLEYAYSFDWYFLKILTILLAIEFFMIVTRKRKLLSVAMASMFIFSSFYQWWAHPGMWYSFFGAIVFFNMFFEVEGWKKIPVGLLAAYFANTFIFLLYPAWEVPMGYVALVFLVYIITENFQKIKKFKKTEWLYLFMALACLGVLVVVSYLARTAYIENVTATVYPGKRESAGGYYLQKLYFYASGTFFSYKDTVSNSEYGSIITLFPLPVILASILLIKDGIEGKKKDILTIGMLIVFGILFLYCSVPGLPLSIARLILINNSIPDRAVDILAFTQLIFLARFMSSYINRFDESETKPRKCLRYLVSFMVGGSIALYTLHVNNFYLTEYLSFKMQIFDVILITALCTLICASDSVIGYRIILITLMVVSLFTGVFVRPVSRGLDSVFTKPVVAEFDKIESEDPDAIWLTMDSIITQSYLSACGLDVLNVVHSLPDMELWRKLDPEGQYNEVYNRYEHIVVSLTYEETSFELVQADMIKLNLSTKDLYKTGVKYIYSHTDYEIDDEYIKTELLYNESNAYIYKVEYK